MTPKYSIKAGNKYVKQGSDFEISIMEVFGKGKYANVLYFDFDILGGEIYSSCRMTRVSTLHKRLKRNNMYLLKKV